MFMIIYGVTGLIWRYPLIKSQDIKEKREEQKSKKEAQQEAELKAKQEAEFKAKQEAEFKVKQEAEFKVKQETELKAKHEVEEQAKREIKERAEKFGKLIRRSTRMKISQVSLLLKMEETELIDWMIDLPEEYGFIINEDIIEFDTETIEDNIDKLLESFAHMEEEKIGKS